MAALVAPKETLDSLFLYSNLLEQKKDTYRSL